MSKRVKGGIAALCCGFLYGIIPLFVLGVSRSGVASGTACSMYRLLFAGLIPAPVAIIRYKKRPVSAKALRNVCFVGLMSGVTAMLLYEAFARIPSGIAMAVHYIYPLTTLCIAVLLFKQKVSRAALPAALLVLAGVAFLCDMTVLPEKPLAGLLLAFGSAIGCSTYYTLIERLDTEGCDKLVFTSLMNLSASVYLFFYNLLTGNLTAAFTVSQWGSLFLSGVLMVGAVLCVTVAVKNVGTVTTTVFSTLEPIVCALGSALMLGDPVTLRTLFGTVLVLSAVILVSVSGKNEPGTDDRGV